MQARRRTLLVLEDETRRVTDAARVLGEEFLALSKGDKMGVQNALERIRKAEEDVVTLRRALIRELAQVGTLLVNREDLLRTAFNVEDIVGHVNGTAFRMSQLRKSMFGSKQYRATVTDVLNLLIESITKLNECVRALSINPDQSIEIATQIQRLESEIDFKYREMIVAIVKITHGYRDLILMKDFVQAIEDASDATLMAADATTVVALGV
jgi:predicted phosphate transport protein (TIGR00153 family)